MPQRDSFRHPMLTGPILAQLGRKWTTLGQNWPKLDRCRSTSGPGRLNWSKPRLTSNKHGPVSAHLGQIWPAATTLYRSPPTSANIGRSRTHLGQSWLHVAATVEQLWPVSTEFGGHARRVSLALARGDGRHGSVGGSACCGRHEVLAWGTRLGLGTGGPFSGPSGGVGWGAMGGSSGVGLFRVSFRNGGSERRAGRAFVPQNLSRKLSFSRTSAPLAPVFVQNRAWGARFGTLGSCWCRQRFRLSCSTDRAASVCLPLTGGTVDVPAVISPHVESDLAQRFPIQFKPIHVNCL